jgi:hypothetical protein
MRRPMQESFLAGVSGRLRHLPLDQNFDISFYSLRQPKRPTPTLISIHSGHPDVRAVHLLKIPNAWVMGFCPCKLVSKGSAKHLAESIFSLRRELARANWKRAQPRAFRRRYPCGIGYLTRLSRG